MIYDFAIHLSFFVVNTINSISDMRAFDALLMERTCCRLHLAAVAAAVAATGEFAAETLLHKTLHPLAQLLARNGAEHFVGEGHLLEQAGVFHPDSAAAHIEKFVLVEAPYGAAVAAFHIVGINFELWLGECLCRIRKDEIVVGLESLRLLSIGHHGDATVELRDPFILKDALEELAGGALRHVVEQFHRIVHQLPGVGEIESAEIAVGVTSVEVYLHRVVYHAAVQLHEHHIQHRPFLKRNVEGGVVLGLVVLVLHNEEVHPRPSPEGYLHLLVGLEGIHREGVGALEHAARRVLSEAECLLQGDGAEIVGIADADELEHLLHSLTLLHIQYERSGFALRHTVHDVALVCLLQRHLAAEFA